MASATKDVPALFPRGLRRIGRFLFEWAPLIIVGALWEAASGRLVDERMFPPPSEVLYQVYTQFAHEDLFNQLGISLYRVAVGLGLSITVGVMLGIGMARLRSVENFFDIFLAMLYPIPKAGLVPLAILWFGRGTDMAIFIIFLACLLPIVLNSYNAALAVDQSLIWSAKMMGTSDRQLLWKIILPDAIPQIMTGVRQSIPIAFIALTGAEFLGSPDGVGAVIIFENQLGNYSRAFAAIVVISATAFLALQLFDRLQHRVIKWT